jgi:hypothetical protein
VFYIILCLIIKNKISKVHKIILNNDFYWFVFNRLILEPLLHECAERLTQMHQNNSSLLPPKTSLSAQNMKTGRDALVTDENESERAKHENGTRRPRYRRKRVGRAKHENVTLRPRYRRK